MRKWSLNQHCECALIVGPVLESKERCGRICGGKGEVEVEAEGGCSGDCGEKSEVEGEIKGVGSHVAEDTRT